MGPSGAMVGRENELEQLMSHMARALAGHGSLVLVMGEAGLGKTTLCEAFEQMAFHSGCIILVGRCIPGSQTPYLPFLEAFSERMPNPFADEEAMMGMGGKLLLSVLDSVDRLSDQKVLIVRLEDLHWADSATIALLHFLARNIQGRRVLLIGTYRPEEMLAATTGEAHPLKESLRIMKREGLCSELELNPLEPAMTRGMVPLRLGGAVEGKLEDLVANDSQGNPLFAVEMINYLVGSEQVVLDTGIWRLRLKGKMQVPSTVREVIMVRIEHLPKDVRYVLDFAAVVGERFDPALLVDGIAIERMALLERLEILDKDFRLIREENSHYRFSHDKIRQVVYEGISVARRRELHRSVGLLLERRLPDDELLGQISLHFLEADDDERCVRYSLAAGRLCLGRKALREAKSFLLLVLERSKDDPKFAAERLDALEALGDLKNDASSLREWCSYYERFLESNHDPRARARVLAKAAECWDQIGLGDKGKANKLLDEAEAIADDDPWILAEIAYRRADLKSNDGEIQDALQLVTASRRFFESLEDTAGAFKCRELEIVILRQAHQMRAARALAEEQLQMAKGINDPERLLRFDMLAAFVCAIIGDTEPAKRYAIGAIDLASKLGMTWTLELALAYRAVALDLEGDLEGARADAIRALEYAREHENAFHAAMFGTDLGIYEAELGLLESAEAHYREVARAASDFEPYARSMLDTDLSILRAELLARNGHYDESDEIFEKAMAQAHALGQRYEAMKCLARHAMSLARRGIEIATRQRFEEAMELATEIGCEPRVRALAVRVGISI